MSDISVVMGTYNGARYVREQLESIGRQTVTPCELIVADDGSRDETLEIVAQFGRDAPFPVRVGVNPTSLGFSENFLRATRRAAGAYVAFADQDDRWAPRKLELTRAAIDEHGADLCTHQVNLMDATGQLIGHDDQTITRTQLLPPGVGDPWGKFFGFTMLFRRTLLDLLPEDRRGPDLFDPQTLLSHDRWVYFLASNFGRICMLDERLADYRQHPAQLYGARRDSLGQRVRVKLAEGPDRLQAMVVMTRQRSELLAGFEAAGGDARFRAVAGRYRRLAELTEMRNDVFQARRRSARAAVLARNIRAGVYRSPRRGGLGPERMVEDLVMGVRASTVVPVDREPGS
ncbi:glycosyltransferase [Goekera deserti]|uniref:Glycosyltransferase n=1 Tax=Goekera deserti TaxID=2497753 RepID=A0A7K3WF51_9ACTN|nr:glycosyltransferase [Goekera deserti]NDI48557.1 glycosyltransferase [Goekera deserti]NEL55064.1 glycosyltransferase [Goekera deserti]